MATYNREPCYKTTCFGPAHPDDVFCDGKTAHYHNPTDASDAIVKADQ